MLLNTFIKLDRSIINWRWFQDRNTLQVWIYILVSANFTQHDFMKTTIRPGELATSHESIANATGLTISQVRTALDHLQETGEIAIKRYPKFLVISAKNYTAYQSNRNQIAIKSQADHNQIAGKSQQYNKEIMKECKNEIMKECGEQKHPHGKLNNVYITDSEYETFRSEYPAIADRVIDELSAKIATGDRRYSSGHIGHLFVFARNYTPEKKTEHKPSYDIDMIMDRSRNLDPTKTKRTDW